MAGTQPIDEAIRARYRDNTARHLIGVARDLQHRVMHHLVNERGHDDLRPSLGPLLSLVAVEARTLGELAGLLSISPQACSQLVGLAETSGYLARRADADDRRARRVTLTAAGRRLLDDGLEVLKSVAHDYRGLIGDAAYARLVEGLGLIFRRLDLLKLAPDVQPDAQPTPLTTRFATDSIGVLPLVSVRIQQDLMAATTARGHTGLKMSHAQVLPLIGPEGARVKELARIQRVSRQAISATARDLETLGVLRRESDPRDRRAVVYRLTARGERLLADSVASLDALDADLRTLLGKGRFEEIERSARALYRALHLEEEIFATAAGARPAPPVTHRSRLPRSLEPSRPAGEESDRVHALAESLRRELTPSARRRLATLLDGAEGPRTSADPAEPSARGRSATSTSTSTRTRTRTRTRTKTSMGSSARRTLETRMSKATKETKETREKREERS